MKHLNGQLDEIIAECSHDCPACLPYKNINYAKRLCNSYKNDAIKIADSGTKYVSCEMQTVALLWFPSNKKCLFTPRLVIIKQWFVPIGDSKICSKNSVGVLGHEAVAWRKDEDVSST